MTRCIPTRPKSGLQWPQAGRSSEKLLNSTSLSYIWSLSIPAEMKISKSVNPWREHPSVKSSARHRCSFLPTTSDLDSSHLKYLLDQPNPRDGERTILRQIAVTYCRTDLHFSTGAIPLFCHMPLKNHLT